MIASNQSVQRTATRLVSARRVVTMSSMFATLAPEGTPFQRKVWDALVEIPFGETTSYGELARRIGNPNASRAVGLANGTNPIPIVIPCHRVIGSTGKLTGYGGGLETKRWLLDFEAANSGLLLPYLAHDRSTGAV